MVRKGTYLLKRLDRFIPGNVLATLTLRFFGLTKIPLLLFVRPSVIELSRERVVVRIPLRRRTMNHLRSMYFGALAMGADCAGGLMAMKLIQESSENISLIFKTLSAEFLKRAEGDVHFICNDGNVISDLVNAAAESTERVESPIHVIATVPSKLGDEPVARFTLILSLKKKT